MYQKPNTYFKISINSYLTVGAHNQDINNKITYTTSWKKTEKHQKYTNV